MKPKPVAVFLPAVVPPLGLARGQVTRGDDDACSDVSFRGDQWIARVGLQSACSPSFLTYLEVAAARSIA